MTKKITVFILLSLLTSVFSYSQVPNPTLYPGEVWTGLYSATYDYQTNGSVRYFLQDPITPSNLFAMMMACEDSTDISFTFRYIYYTYSSNYGRTWQDVGQVSTTRSGFPAASLVNGTPVVTFGVGSGTNSSISVYQDASFGSYTFYQNNPPNTLAFMWSCIAGNPSGNQFVVTASNFTGSGPVPLFRITYNGSSYGSWHPVGSLGGPSGQVSVAYGTGGNVAIVGFSYDSSTTNGAKNSTVWIFKSTDNGNTFDNGTVVFQHAIEGPDTVVHYVTGGLQAVYVGTEPHVVFGASSWQTPLPVPIHGANANKYFKSRIYHWSPSTCLSIVSDSTSSPYITDTIVQVNMEPRCQCTIGKLASGKLVCAFTGYPRGDGQIVDNGDTVSCGDIYVTVSTNNGMSWTIPINWTNPVHLANHLEEKHPSIISVSSDDSLRIFYLRDMKAGSFVNVAGWGKAPNYGLIKVAYTSLPGFDPLSHSALRFKLEQNYPNPFNPVTTINYTIARNSFVTLKVYDILGREVRTLINQYQSEGIKTVQFDGSDLASGVYVYKLFAGDYVETKKMILIK